MKIEPVRYKRLIMQLMTPTPIKALRQARSASPSSERRTGAAAINPYLFKRIKGTCRFYRCFGTSSIGVALTIQFTPHEAGGDETPPLGSPFDCGYPPVRAGSGLGSP